MLRQNQTTVAAGTCRERPETDVKRHGLVYSIHPKKDRTVFPGCTLWLCQNSYLKWPCIVMFHDLSH